MFYQINFLYVDITENYEELYFTTIFVGIFRGNTISLLLVIGNMCTVRKVLNIMFKEDLDCYT